MPNGDMLDVRDNEDVAIVKLSMYKIGMYCHMCSNQTNMICEMMKMLRLRNEVCSRYG
jgi:hypothetical protein